VCAVGVRSINWCAQESGRTQSGPSAIDRIFAILHLQFAKHSDRRHACIPKHVIMYIIVMNEVIWRRDRILGFSRRVADIRCTGLPLMYTEDPRQPAISPGSVLYVNVRYVKVRVVSFVRTPEFPRRRGWREDLPDLPTHRTARWTSTGLPSRTPWLIMRYVLVLPLSSFSWRVCRTKLAFS